MASYVPPLSGALNQTSPFGLRGGVLHAGVDYAAPQGTPVRAVLPGVVTVAGLNGGWGNTVVIDHGIVDGQHLYTRYAHLYTQPSVAVGQTIAAGQTLGGVGSTGDSTGNHLHFGTYVGTVDNAGARAPGSILTGGLLQTASPDAPGAAPGGASLDALAAIATGVQATAAGLSQMGRVADARLRTTEQITKLALPSNMIRVAAGVFGIIFLLFAVFFLAREMKTER